MEKGPSMQQNYLANMYSRTFFEVTSGSNSPSVCSYWVSKKNITVEDPMRHAPLLTKFEYVSSHTEPPPSSPHDTSPDNYVAENRHKGNNFINADANSSSKNRFCSKTSSSRSLCTAIPIWSSFAVQSVIIFITAAAALSGINFAPSPATSIDKTSLCLFRFAKNQPNM